MVKLLLLFLLNNVSNHKIVNKSVVIKALGNLSVALAMIDPEIVNLAVADSDAADSDSDIAVSDIANLVVTNSEASDSEVSDSEVDRIEATASNITFLRNPLFYLAILLSPFSMTFYHALLMNYHDADVTIITQICHRNNSEIDFEENFSRIMSRAETCIDKIEKGFSRSDYNISDEVKVMLRKTSSCVPTNVLPLVLERVESFQPRQKIPDKQLVTFYNTQGNQQLMCRFSNLFKTNTFFAIPFAQYFYDISKQLYETRLEQNSLLVTQKALIALNSELFQDYEDKKTSYALLKPRIKNSAKELQALRDRDKKLYQKIVHHRSAHPQLAKIAHQMVVVVMNLSKSKGDNTTSNL